MQGIQRQLIGIGETGFLTADGAHAYALIDIVGAVFNNAVFQHPGFMVAGLKIEVSVIQLALGQLAENGKEVALTNVVSS